MNKNKLTTLARVWKDRKPRSPNEITAFIMGVTCVLMVLDFVHMVDVHIIQKEIRNVLMEK